MSPIVGIDLLTYLSGYLLLLYMMPKQVSFIPKCFLHYFLG